MRQLGRYRLDRIVGSGAFATVWQGHDPELDTAVAIKVLAENWALHADVRERFLDEARLLRRIDSARVVRVHDIGVWEDRPFFVMDYVIGGTLADRVGAVSTVEALRLAREAAEAVQVLHEAGLIHRDVKPSNLLVDPASAPTRVLVADLGSVKRLADASGYTVTTGTPAYMAPELVGGTDKFDGRADVYALAVVTWELLTGSRPPSPTPDPGQLRRFALIAGISPAIADVLCSALDRNPDRRPRDAATLAHALGPSVAGRRRDVPAPLVITLALIAFALAALLGWLILP